MAGARVAVAAAVLVCGSARAADAAPSPLPTDVQTVWQGVLQADDAAGLPFAIVDKHNARLWVFDARGALRGATPALLGAALGDSSAPGVGRLVSMGIPAALRTTPAGRFDTRPGHNHKGEAVVWVDYDAALAIHRLRPAPAHERRPERLASATPADNRISLGCVVVSAAFYDSVVAPTLGRSRAVVYVLPDSQSLQQTFGALAGAGL